MLENQLKRKRRHKKIRSRVKGTADIPRLFVFRSSNHIYAQLINDDKGKTLVSACDIDIENKKLKNGKGKVFSASEVGKLIAQKAQENKIKKVVFDRGGYKYHGRVKALADGAREGGLEF